MRENGPPLRQWLGHFDQVAGDAGAHGCGRRQFAGNFVTEAAIVGWEFGSEIDHGYVHCDTSLLTSVVLDGLNEEATQATSLSVWFDRQHSEISTVLALFKIHTTGDLMVGGLGQKILALVEHLGVLIDVGTVVHQEERLDLKGAVNDGDDGGDVLASGATDVDVGRLWDCRHGKYCLRIDGLRFGE